MLFIWPFRLDTQDAPTNLSLESSSSVESLTSDEEEEEREQEGAAGSQHNVVSSRSGRSAPSVVSSGGGAGSTNGAGRVGTGNHQTYSSLVSRRMPLSASVKSAFSSYVRSGCRGEPDGRTAVGGDSRGRESDAAFTPSPVDPVHRTSKIIIQLESFVIVIATYYCLLYRLGSQGTRWHCQPFGRHVQRCWK